MSSISELYAELKTDMVALADPLFDQSQKQLQARDRFLPHAAVLDTEGKVVLVGAMTGSKGGQANTEQILPMLHKGIRQMSREKVLVATAVATDVSLTRGDMPMQAIKVQIEHERGLNVALFLPFYKSEEGDYYFGEAFVMPVHSELKLWPPVP